MALMTIADIPNEVLTVYSRDALFEAMPMMYFRNFCAFKQELGAEPGETVQFLKIANLAPGGMLPSETSPIPKQKYSDSIVSIQVHEYGNAVQMSKRALEASFRNMMQDAATLLGRDYGLTVDRVCRDAFLSTGNKQYMTSSAGNGKPADGEGTTIGQVNGTFSAYAIKNAIETLKTNNAPMVVRGGDQFYVCAAHPHQIRSLRDDPDWLNAVRYGNPQLLYNGEVGRFENVIFLETTQMPILVGAGKGGANVYRAVVWGSEPVGFAETVPFGLVNDGVEDFGRLVSIGWYSIFGAGIIQDFIVEIDTL